MENDEEVAVESGTWIKPDDDRRRVDIVISMHNAGPGKVISASASVRNLDAKDQLDHDAVEFGEIPAKKTTTRIAKLTGAADIVSFSARFDDGKLWLGGWEQKKMRRIGIKVPGRE